MRTWTAERIAREAGAELGAGPSTAGGPARVVIDSREAAPDRLFAGLPGTRTDGGAFAAEVLQAGAWGVLVAPEHAEGLGGAGGDAVVLVSPDPLASLQRLATAYRRDLGAKVVGVTGSVGKTSTKDVLRAFVAAAGVPVHANERNLNTEIGLPLTVLAAPPDTEVLVLEMGMRGRGQIAELAAIAEPDVGLITALGPVHLEQMGSMEAIAHEKAALLRGLRPGGVAVVPAGEPLLDEHVSAARRAGAQVVLFGEDEHALEPYELPFASAHLRRNALGALAAAHAVGAVPPPGRIDVALSELRGERLRLASGVTIVNDCYNANPVSMRAALDDLAATAPGRRVAVLGDMRELGPDERAFHAEVGRYAREAAGVDVLVAVGPLSEAYGGDHHVPDAQAAAGLVPGLLREGDTVLVKASRGVGLEVVAEALA